ncbi:MAG: sigma 54 modulation/S30EA ribosomal C-terminal domain-containing protein [Acidimicrobiales bacterium]
MPGATDTTKLSITSHGDVDEDNILYATDKVTEIITGLDAPVLLAEVRLTQEPDPARERPSIVEALLDVNGQPVRAHVAAHEMRAAIDLLVDRLRRRLDRFAHVRDDRRARLREHRVGGEHEWRHGDRPSQRPEYFDRPAEERQIVRRKSYSVGEMTPDEAADALDLLGHDFFLFTNLHTGADAVVYYADDHALELIDASGRSDAIGPDTVAPVSLAGLAAPRCTTAEATQELDLGIVPFVFYVDPESGRGCVVYHRYDGNYGLITPT